MIKALVFQGGGVRGIASAGVAATVLQREKLTSFDVITGDSFGALNAALVASAWNSEKIKRFLVKAPFRRLITPWMPWGARKLSIPAFPVSLKRVAAYLDEHIPSDGLKLPLIINAWDAKSNKQVFYCDKKPEWADNTFNFPSRWVEGAWEEHSLGTLITRSMALPGLIADDPRYFDGGLAEHPPMAFLPHGADVHLIELGYPGKLKKIPKGLVERGLYSYEVKSTMLSHAVNWEFSNLSVYNPHVFDVDSLALDMNAADRLALYNRGLAISLH